jgi:alkylhydroperoxidase family enzyme
MPGPPAKSSSASTDSMPGAKPRTTPIANARPLEWTEALTDVTDGHVPEAVYDAVRDHFSEKELADLTWAVAAINAWNRISIAFRSEAGTYRAGEQA